MQKLYYKTHQAARSHDAKGERNTGKPSRTIPGEVETIAEMFRKFQNGIPIRSRPRSDADYTTLDHNSPNFELLHPSTDRLTAKVVMPEDPIEKAKAAAAKKEEEAKAEASKKSKSQEDAES